MKNARLDQTLDHTRADVHEKNMELDEKSKEINNLTRQLISSQNQTHNVQQNILKLQQE